MIYRGLVSVAFVNNSHIKERDHCQSEAARSRPFIARSALKQRGTSIVSYPDVSRGLGLDSLTRVIIFFDKQGVLRTNSKSDRNANEIAEMTLNYEKAKKDNKTLQICFDNLFH